MPVPVVMQRAGVTQSGPLAVSHAPPSEAGATQVPMFEPVARWQKLPAPHATSTVPTTPHCPPAAAIVWVAHVLFDVSHVRPAAALHCGCAINRTSQAAPTVVPCGWQVPDVVAVEPTHDSPAPHGIAREHEPPEASGT